MTQNFPTEKGLLHRNRRPALGDSEHFQASLFHRGLVRGPVPRDLGRSPIEPGPRRGARDQPIRLFQFSSERREIGRFHLVGQLHLAAVDPYPHGTKMITLEVEADRGALGEELGEHSGFLGRGGLGFLLWRRGGGEWQRSVASRWDAARLFGRCGGEQFGLSGVRRMRWRTVRWARYRTGWIGRCSVEVWRTVR